MRRLGLALLALLVALGAFYYFFELRHRETRALRVRVLVFEQDRVEEIVVAKNGERVVARRGDQGWWLSEPVLARADGNAIDGLLHYVARLEKARELDAETSVHGQFGLDAPFVSLTLRLRGRSEPVTLHLGDRSRLGDWVYAKHEGAGSVFLAPARLRDELGKMPYAYELRDKTLWAFDEWKVTALEIERRDVRIRLRKAPRSEWEILSPLNGQADRGIISDLLWKMRHTKVLHFMDDAGDDPGRHGLVRPDVRATIWEDNRSVGRLSLWQRSPVPGAVYARVEPGGLMSLAERRLLDDLSLDPRILRNRLLFTFDEADVVGVEIRHPDEVVLVDRRAGGWTLRGPAPQEADETRVQNLIDAVRNLRFRTRQSERVDDVARYGLDRPRLELTLRLTDGRVLPTLRVGQRDENHYYATVGGIPPVYSVDRNLIGRIPARALELRKLSPEEQLRRSWVETKEFLESLKREK